jgi:hypothetical protein
MSMVRMKKQCISLIGTLLLALLAPTCRGYLSTYSRNDPWPVYTSLDPHTFLYTRELQPYMGEEAVSKNPQYFGFSLSAFGQNACKGKGYINTTDSCDTLVPIELGDLQGKWSLVGMLFGQRPDGVAALPPTLNTAFQDLFPGQEWGTVDYDPTIWDRCMAFAFVSFPLKYRKRGARFEFDFRIIDDIGLIVQGGVSDICQVVNKTMSDANDGCSATCACCPLDTSKQTLAKADLICKYDEIAQELCLDLGIFHNFSFEDVRFIGYWRRAYESNRDRETWPHFLTIPFLTVGGSIAAGKEKKSNKVFGLPFGNDGHNSIGATAGIDINFVETISIGGEAGVTHFFKHDVCGMYVPTSPYQYHIFPFATDVTVEPGLNWHCGVKMLAYQFLDRLSCYFQYMIITHREDCIKLKCSDPAFLPCVLEKRSCWQTQLANIGLNYDISPYMSLGFLWQAPLSQKASYRTSTGLFTFSAAF